MSDQDPYGQPQQPPRQPPGYQQPGNPPPGFPAQGFGTSPLPKHPQAQTALILGIVALAGGATCLLPILASPFAWYYGVKAKREMEAEPGRWSGQSDAQAGFVMGMIGTAGIVLGVLALGAIISIFALVAVSANSHY